MPCRWILFILGSLGAAFFPAVAESQTGGPFLLRVQQGESVSVVPNGGTVGLAVGSVGREMAVTITATYRGNVAALVYRLELIGAPDFVVLDQPAFPLIAVVDESFRFTVRFTAASSARVTTLAAVSYNELDARGNPVGSGSIVLNFVGTAPELAAAYYIQNEGNNFPLLSGSVLLFPETKAGASAAAVVSVFNRGSAPGLVQSVSLTGQDFQLLGVPLLPAALGAGLQFQFLVRYAPKQIGPSSGSLRLALEDRTLDIALQGFSIGPVFAYELIEGEAGAPLVPGRPLQLLETQVGQRRDFIVVVRNNGNGEGQISGVALLGAGFQLTDVPFMPAVLEPGSSLFIGFSFMPAQVGQVTGRLRIGSDTFEIQAPVSGARLAYSYFTGGSTVTVQPNATVGMAATAVGLSSEIRFTVTNEGTSPATINSVVVSGAGFSIPYSPSLPATLAPGASLSFLVAFKPAAIGSVSGVLRVDAHSFTVSAFGMAPPSLPAIRYEGASGVQEPASQPAIGLTLAEPYPLNLRGALAITIDSEGASADPAVRFSTGGRTVTFTIPANSTRAVFPNNTAQIRLQTGTVASTIIISPSFLTQEGLDVTPQSPPLLTLTVPPLAPRLLDAQITSQTATSFLVVVTGYATTRSLAKVDLQFTVAQGFKLPATKFTVELAAQASLWYQSAASQAYGGLFTVSIPFVLKGDTGNSRPAVEAVESAAVTISNALGMSQAITARRP